MEIKYNANSTRADNVSYLVDAKAEPQTKGLIQILNEVKQGNVKTAIENLRQSKSENHNISVAVLKSQLPCFTPSGIFSRWHRKLNIQAYNPMIMLDFDKIGAEKAVELKEVAAKISYTFAAFVRFNGDGLIILVRTNSTQERHATAFWKILHYYEIELGAVSSKSGVNINELCLLSYDPEIYTNENSSTFEYEEQLKEPTTEDSMDEQEFVETSEYKIGIDEESIDFESVSNSSNEKDSKSNTDLSVNLMESIAYYDTQPEPKFLWNGIIEGSFGYIFGPAGSAKTTFCENLGMSLAVGKDSLLGFKIDGTSKKKVLFIPLEEHGRLSSRRNKKQLSQLNEAELTNLDYNVPKEDFPDQLVSEKDWIKLLKLIDEFQPDIVFIDSMTRTVKGKIEDSDFSSEISLKLRNLAKDKGITLIVVHHSTKLNGNPITMDNLAGSRVIAQEADFIYGFNLLPDGTRYLKELKCRYKAISETITIFKINDNAWLEKVKDSFEDQVVTRPDLRENPATELLIYDAILRLTSVTDPDVDTKIVWQEVSNQVTRSEFYRFLSKIEAKGKIKRRRGIISRV